jgi:hypothetical protein
MEEVRYSCTLLLSVVYGCGWGQFGNAEKEDRPLLEAAIKQRLVKPEDVTTRISVYITVYCKA